MTYILPFSIVNNTDELLTIVEKTCWYYANGGTWTDHDPTSISHSNLILTMNGSGTSGMLRIMASSGLTFTVIVGYHNYEFWCDVQVDLSPEETAVKLHPEYYGGGRLSGEARSATKRTAKGGRTVEVHLQNLPCGRPPVVITYS
ncbi:uncharacterized protein BDW70DRAFT_144840 [Aspergillus foveolatus]|uniref:uncharacterized protein n=1 Tax=Aspergillus foveolatus TaxID=210207 RepID=UPI003CCDB487